MKKTLITIGLFSLLTSIPFISLADPITAGEMTEANTEIGISTGETTAANQDLVKENDDINNEDTDIVTKLDANNQAWVERINQQNDYLPSRESILEQGKGPLIQALTIGQEQSDEQLKNNLLSFASVLGPAKHVTNFTKSPKPNQDLIKKLSTDIKTSDDLSFSILPSSPLSSTNDNMMSFDNLINPEQYSSTQKNNAVNDIHLMAQDYQTNYFGLNFNALNRSLGEMPITERKSWLDNNLLNSNAYQLFQAEERTYFAMKSIVSSNLYYIFGQRTTDNQHQTSALKNQNYTIHKIVDNPEFYTDLKTKSPTWLRRSSIQLMLYQARMLHERQQLEQRTLAVDTAQLELELSEQKAQVEQKAEAVNTIIKTAAVNQAIQ